MNKNHNYDIYYLLKPLLPRTLQIFLRRALVRYQLKKYRHIWPIDEMAGKQPPNWQGWPEKKKFALVLTHDVDVEKGQQKCLDLMKLEMGLGFRSSFNFVPLRYRVSSDIRRALEAQGFEVGVHGLYHDGKYYQSEEKFAERAAKINHYIKEWKAVGYRAPSMDHKLDWFHKLDIEYDASTFDTDPFEPHAVGAGTIYPFYVTDDSSRKAYVELPYTLPQDFSLFVLMQEKNTEIWKKKLAWVIDRGGMVLMNTHPDYMNFSNERPGNEEYPSRYYEEFLRYIKTNYEGQYWHALPKDVTKFWKSTYDLNWLQWNACTFPYYNHKCTNAGGVFHKKS